ncbi:uncharacterized protein LOC110402637 [Numida meleagris]|uniref:uncharacterized protein LOC110402637 n=1 Tax=Numida meleagris TaxID=8996 RepID=UPI000B3E1755|nr:uncharacterized protein LOC110402637 [Numida meleagris]
MGPRVVPPGSRSPGSALNGARLPPLPGPESSRASGSRRAQADQRQALPSLLPRPRQATMPAAAPRRAAPSSNVPKLPALQAAASSASSASGRAGAMGIRESRLPELAPRPQGTLRVQDRAARAESRGPVLEVSSTVLVPPHARPKQSYVVSLGCAAAGSPRIGVQLTVPGHHASTSRLRTPARSAQVLATKAGEIPAAWTGAQEGTRDTRSAATPCFVSAQKGAEEQAGGKERDKEPLSTSVPEDAGSSASPRAAHSPGEDNNTMLFPRACEGGERGGAGTTMPEFSTQALGVVPRLQGPRQINPEASGYSPVHPAIRRICDEEGKEQMSSWNISWPDNVSTLRLLRPEAADDSASAAGTAQGMLGLQTMTSKVEGQIPVSGDSQMRDVGVQVELQELEETAERESTGDLSSTSLSSSDEADAMRSASLLATEPGPGGRLEPLPTSVPRGTENTDSFETAHCPEEANTAPLLLSACEGGEREVTAMTMPELSTQALGEAPRLQDPRETYGEAHEYSPIFPAINRIQDEARKEQMLSSWNISWPNNVSTPRLLRPQAADDSASAADAAPGMFDICTTSRIEGQLPPSSDSQTRHDGVQDIQHDLQQSSETETAGPSSADPWRACLAPSDEAEAVPSTSHQDVGHWPAGQLEPLRASVPEDAENSGSSKAVPSPVLAIEAPFFLSLCLRGKIEGRVLAMPEYSRTALGHSPRRRDPKEIYGEAYRYPTTHPAIQRIRDEARKERMMSSWKASWPNSVSMPRLPVPRAAGDGASAAASARGMLDVRSTTSRVEDRFPASRDSQNREEEETSDSTASDTSSDDSMLDDRDSAMMAESLHVPSCFCYGIVEGVEEERESNCREDAAEAARVAPSISGSSSGEVKTRPSASPVAADPRPVRQSSTCEGAEAAACQQEDSAEAREDAQKKVGTFGKIHLLESS